jgi:hypothetical protein
MFDPFRVFRNQFSFVEGNPFIQPEFVDIFSLTFVKNNNFTVTLDYTYLSDGKSQFSVVNPETNIIETTYDNFFDSILYDLKFSYRIKSFKWWNNYNSLVINYRETSSRDPILLNDAKRFGYSFYQSNRFTLNKNKTFFIENNISYQSSTVINVLTLKDRFNFNLGLRYLVWDKKLQLNLSALDIFRSNQSRTSSITNGIRFQSNNYYDNRKIRFSMRYTFGNSKLRIKRNSQKNKEERNRIN